MFNQINSNKTDIFFIGDVHGEFKSIPRWIELNNLSHCIIIFCGDFGLGFHSLQHERQELDKADKICEALDIDCYIIRGNHDDPSYFTSEKLSLSRFKPVSDYTVIHTPEHNILCAGGAVSVDRMYRKEIYEERIYNLMLSMECELPEAIANTQRIWWEDEGFVYDGVKLENITNSRLKIDVVATHNSPDFCYPISKKFTQEIKKEDPTLEDDCNNERIDLARLYNYLSENGHTITHWFYGHFHQHHFDVIDDTKFYTLDMGRVSPTSSSPGGVFHMVELH